MKVKLYCHEELGDGGGILERIFMAEKIPFEKEAAYGDKLPNTPEGRLRLRIYAVNCLEVYTDDEMGMRLVWEGYELKIGPGIVMAVMLDKR